MQQKVTCQFSSELFSGFQVEIDMTNFLSFVHPVSDTINICKYSLISVLENYNFEKLVERATKTEFHIHNFDLTEIKENPQNIIWICDHC